MALYSCFTHAGTWRSTSTGRRYKRPPARATHARARFKTARVAVHMLALPHYQRFMANGVATYVDLHDL
jgi:hypothetical protein